MKENFADTAHALQAPHRDFADADHPLPAHFVPLRLELRSMDIYPRQHIYELTKPAAIVGRHSEADLRLAFADVSRRHCRFEFRDGCWHVYDLESLNGLHVNGERTLHATLQEGDFIRIGSVTLVVLNDVSARSGAWSSEVLRSIADNLQ